MERPWPLTGRDEELRRVAAAIRPGAAGIVVAGPAGVGKTRLAREAVAVSGGRGATVVWAQGSTAARPLPLGAFAGLLDVPAGDAAETIGRALGSSPGSGRWCWPSTTRTCSTSTPRSCCTAWWFGGWHRSWSRSGLGSRRPTW